MMDSFPPYKEKNKPKFKFITIIVHGSVQRKTEAN
jgi:hypothetical protein